MMEKSFGFAKGKVHRATKGSTFSALLFLFSPPLSYVLSTKDPIMNENETLKPPLTIPTLWPF